MDFSHFEHRNGVIANPLMVCNAVIFPEQQTGEVGGEVEPKCQIAGDAE
jgi:hypothetical protein